MTVNRKQFHYLLVRFLQKHHLQKLWFNDSKDYKRCDTARVGTYNKYGLTLEENYSDFLYKCIDIYIGEAIFTTGLQFYGNSIRGFFRFIPAGGCSHNWNIFWERYSSLWEKETSGIDIAYEKDNS